VRDDRLAVWLTMTTFLLIRHGLCDAVGQSIAGRSPGVHLNQAGKQQAARLAERLADLALAGLYSSPLERALETAQPIAVRHALQIQTLQGLNEIDFGEWTGRSLADLDQLSGWRTFNSLRSGSRIPGGENMADVLARSLGDIERLVQLHPGPSTLVAVVSHGDVLRALVAHALGISLDLMQRLELSPASISILQVEDQGPRVLLLNSIDGWPSGFPSSKAR
jgi:probable phosphomutase (TIGR03848 family)